MISSQRAGVWLRNGVSVRYRILISMDPSTSNDYLFNVTGRRRLIRVNSIGYPFLATLVATSKDRRPQILSDRQVGCEDPA